MPNRKFPSTTTQSPMKPNHQKFQKTPQNGSDEKPKTILQPDRKLQQQQKQQSPQATLQQGGNPSSVGQAKPNKNHNPNQVQVQVQVQQQQQPKSDVPPAEGPKKKQKRLRLGKVNEDIFNFKDIVLFRKTEYIQKNSKSLVVFPWNYKFSRYTFG